jgi:hypothetical protein
MDQLPTMPYDSSPTPNRSGLRSTIMTMAATSPVDSVWTRKTTRLIRLSSCRPRVVSSCQLHCAALSSSCRASWLSHCLLSSSHCAALSSSCLASWFSHCLSPSSRCATLSSTHRTSLLSHRIASPRPLVAPRLLSHHPSSSSRCADWLLHRLSTGHPLIVSSCRLSFSCHASSHRPLVAPPSHPLIVLAGCCTASPCTPLSSSRRSPSPTPSTAVKGCCRHRTTPPPPPLNAVSIVHRCHGCRPSPPSNANAHLRPLLENE